MLEFSSVSLYQIIVGVESFFGGLLEYLLLLFPILVFFGITYNNLRKRWADYRKKNKHEAKKFRELVRELRTKENFEDRKRARVEVLKILRKNAIVTVIFLAVIIVIIISGDHLLTQIHQDNRKTVKESLAIWDAQMNGLYRNTQSSITEESNNSESVSVNNERSEIELKLARLDRLIRMSEERTVQIRDEFYCGRKVEDYITEKRYAGYEEIDIVFGIIRHFDICMLEKGWHVETCPEDLRNSDQCKHLLYIETECAKRFREWLRVSETQREALPCDGSMKWRAYW